jgi:type III secretory pathway lipoprotein EscJ
MKPSIVPAQKTTSASSSTLTVLPTAKAKIVRHPQSKKIEEKTLLKKKSLVSPPDEETLKRLNAIAQQHPFCVSHRDGHHRGLL